MDKNIMERGNLTLEKSKEIFRRLDVFEDFKEFMKSDKIRGIVDSAFSACMSALQQMTSMAPAERKEIAEKNLKAFHGSKESFVSDFEFNFQRIVADNLAVILDWVHDEESVRNFINLEMTTNENTQTQGTAKQIVDQMIMDITKEYILCTYDGYIPNGVSNASQYIIVSNDDDVKVIVPKVVLGI